MTLLTLFMGVGFKWPQILTLYVLGWTGFVLRIPKMYWPGYPKIQEDEETPIKLRVILL